MHSQEKEEGIINYDEFQFMLSFPINFCPPQKPGGVRRVKRDLIPHSVRVTRVR